MLLLSIALGKEGCPGPFAWASGLAGIGEYYHPDFDTESKAEAEGRLDAALPDALAVAFQ